MILVLHWKGYSLFQGSSNKEEVWVWKAKDAQETGWLFSNACRTIVKIIWLVPCNIRDQNWNQRREAIRKQILVHYKERILWQIMVAEKK